MYFEPIVDDFIQEFREEGEASQCGGKTTDIINLDIDLNSVHVCTQEHKTIPAN